MSVIDKLSAISDTLSKVFQYAMENQEIKDDFDEYLKTIGAYNAKQSDINSLLVTYAFERTFNKGQDTVFSMYLNDNKLDSIEKEIVEALQKSIDALFEVKSVKSNGFNLYNLVNEKDYFAMPLVKMSHLRGIYKGNYILARIFPFESSYFIIEIRDIYSSLDKNKVLRYAVAKIIEQPENLYKDNDSKLIEVETEIANFSKKFKECFNSDEVITTNEYVDQLISEFNDYYFDDNKDIATIKDLVKPIESYSYFKVPEFNSSYDNYIESSMAGFSSHSSKYDVGVIFDDELGMYIVPFYGTLCHILESENYQEIEGWDDCIKSFINNDKIPAKLIQRLYEKFPSLNNRLNELYGTEKSFNEFLEELKPDSLRNKIYSPTSVLYASKSFGDLMGFIPTEDELKIKEIQDNNKNIGRNEPCPCGSGKKYKKCCGAML